MDFDFGRTSECKAFFERYPNFYPAFDCLRIISNKVFEPRQLKTRSEEVYLRLGTACRVDFQEILFLAVNGHAPGATKLLRGLYERAVTLAYLLKYPTKVNRFIAYAAVSEYKLVQAAKKLATVEEMDATLKSDSVAAIEQRFNQYKGQFLRGTDKKKIAPSWEKDFASQVTQVGTPFSNYYLAAYLMPTQHTHATLTSIIPPDDAARRQEGGDFSLKIAHALLAELLKLFNKQYPRVTDEDFDSCQNAFSLAWNLPRDAPDTENGPI